MKGLDKNENFLIYTQQLKWGAYSRWLFRPKRTPLYNIGRTKPLMQVNADHNKINGEKRR